MGNDGVAIEPNNRTAKDRSLVLSGRLGVLLELVALADDLGDRIKVGAGDDVNLPILVQNWRDLHRWMEQARDEVLDEVKLLKSGS